MWVGHLRSPVAVAVNTRGGYRPELDGLRGIAVLAVMAYHFGVPGAQHGFLGVDVFFVLSGFLITSILAAEFGRTGRVDIRGFYIRRARRLLPALVLMLAVVTPTVRPVEAAASIGYVMNWAIAFDWITPVPRSLGHTWSLAIEEQFYLLWPLLLTVCLARWRAVTVGRVMIAAALVVAAWRAVVWTMDPDWIRVFSGTDTHADGLLIGSALALVPIALPRRPAIVLIGAAVVVPALPLGFFALIGDLIAVLATVALITRPPRVLSARPLVAVGKISYGLYLWHVPIWVGLGDSGVVSPILAGVLTFLAAGLSYRYLEQPILRLGAHDAVRHRGREDEIAGSAGLRVGQVPDRVTGTG